MSNFIKSRTYDEFVDKFKPRHTTDDCFTPPNVYAVVLDYACRRFHLNRKNVVRPFYPGGDYEHFDYAKNAVVIDNPPFSIITKIVRFYTERNIKFFLFCPGLSAIRCIQDKCVCAIITDTSITYDNKAVVNTSFVTNMAGESVLESSPELQNALKSVLRHSKRNHGTKVNFPNCVVTSASFKHLANHDVAFKLSRRDALFIRKYDCGKEPFGGTFLLSKRAASEYAAAKRAADEHAAKKTIVITLSPREKQLQKTIGTATDTHRAAATRDTPPSKREISRSKSRRASRTANDTPQRSKTL